MAFLHRIIRLFPLGLPALAVLLGGFFYFAPEARSYASLYFKNPEYRPFLLESWKKQGALSSLTIWDENIEVRNLLAKRVSGRGWSEKEITDLALYIVLKSREFGMAPLFTVSLIEVESQFHNHAISSEGARGLMQLMPSTAASLAGARWQGAETLSDPRVNIDLGLRYFKALKTRFRTPEHVLAAYNIGPAALEKRLRMGKRVPTAYYRKVMSVMRGYREGLEALPTI